MSGRGVLRLLPWALVLLLLGPAAIAWINETIALNQSPQTGATPVATQRIPQSEGWTIERFAADITIQKDGRLAIVEAIDVDFGGQHKHGIFRYIPFRYNWDRTHDRVYRLTFTNVTDARGVRVPWTTSEEGAVKIVKIGDPDILVTGTQTYRISYIVDGALNPFDDHDELFWNVNGGDWPARTLNASARVTAPAGITQVTCFVGLLGSREPCRTSASGQTAEFVSPRPFNLGEQLTIVAALPKGAVAAPKPTIERKNDLVAWFDTGAAYLAAAVFTLVLGLFLLYWRWYSVGRDLRERETIVPEYEPPEGLRPAHIGLLLDESADTKDVTATIVDLAVRGYLTITEIPAQGLFSRKDWQLAKTGKSDADLLPYESVIYQGLFALGDPVKLSELRTHFISSLREAQTKLYADSVARGWFVTSPDQTRRRYAGLGVLGIVAGIALAFALGKVFGAGFVGLAVALVGVVTMPLAGVMPGKTALGAEILRRSLGFGRYMEVAETERQRFAEREGIFAAYLPFAIVFGCVERWARAFAGIDTAAQTAAWYSGSDPSGFQALAFSSTLSDFNSSLGSTITSAPSTSGGGGGSGFSGGGGGGSGGGGGGGGGGSW